MVRMTQTPAQESHDFGDYTVTLDWIGSKPHWRASLYLKKEGKSLLVGEFNGVSRGSVLNQALYGVNGVIGSDDSPAIGLG